MTDSHIRNYITLADSSAQYTRVRAVFVFHSDSTPPPYINTRPPGPGPLRQLLFVETARGDLVTVARQKPCGSHSFPAPERSNDSSRCRAIPSAGRIPCQSAAHIHSSVRMPLLIGPGAGQ